MQLPKIAKTRFASYYLTLRCILKVSQDLGVMEMGDALDDISIDRDGANVMKGINLDNDFWSQVRYGLQFTKPIYYMIKFVDLDQLIIREVYGNIDSMLG